MHRNCLWRPWGFDFGEFMVYFQQIWGDPLFLSILVPQLAKKRTGKQSRWRERTCRKGKVGVWKCNKTSGKRYLFFKKKGDKSWCWLSSIISSFQMGKVHFTIENQTSFGNLQSALCDGWSSRICLWYLKHKSWAVKGTEILVTEQKHLAALCAAIAFAGVSVKPGTRWGRRTRTRFRGHRPGGASSFHLCCCAYVSSCCLDSAPLYSFWMGAGDAGSCAGHREAAAAGAECAFDLVEPQRLGLTDGKVDLSSR